MAAPEFRTLDDVEYGRVEQVSPLVRRVIAENPSKFTYRGTGTYLLGHGDVVVIDPGPLLDSHREALARALAGERVRAILVTHCHADHSPLAAWLRDETGAPTFAFGPHPRPTADELADAAEPPDDTGPHDDTGPPDDSEAPDTERPDDAGPPDDHDAGRAPASGEVKIEEAVDHDFAPTDPVVDGDRIDVVAGLTIEAVHTPGHTSNHTCWALAEERALFTGDHVMGWSTTVVSPPDGDMAAYMTSLARVAARDDAVLWPTHGPPRDDARRYVESLAEHRRVRESSILAEVRAGRATCREIVEVLYADVRRELHSPARRSVWAHLVKLVAEGSVAVDDGGRARLASRYVPA